jgi:hypothetical protein
VQFHAPFQEAFSNICVATLPPDMGAGESLLRDFPWIQQFAVEDIARIA